MAKKEMNFEGLQKALEDKVDTPLELEKLEAAVTDETKNDVKPAIRLSDYRKKLRRYRQKRWVRFGTVVLGVLLLLFGVTQVMKYWSYDSYSVLKELSGDDMTTASCSKIGNKLLKFSLDRATLTDSKDKTLWSSSYTMNAPAVTSCQDTIAIYDTQGTTVKVYQDQGLIGTISTDMPIVKAKVAKQGVVAAILESGDNTRIQYYDKAGKSIASFKSTMGEPGYPMDLALSEDGLVMAVSYLQMKQSVPKTEVVFYNWGNAGQNKTDHIVNRETIKNCVAPEVQYLDPSTCLLFLDDGFAVYKGKQIPKRTTRVFEKEEIVSVFYNSSHAGYVIHNNDVGKAYTMKVYDLGGKEIFSQDFDFNYTQITMDDNQVLMYNNRRMCTYSLSGVKKFEGNISEGILNTVIPLSPNRYILVTDNGNYAIKLTK